MIDVVREKLPKEYERVVLEEYYKLLLICMVQVRLFLEDL